MQSPLRFSKFLRLTVWDGSVLPESVLNYSDCYSSCVTSGKLPVNTFLHSVPRDRPRFKQAAQWGKVRNPVADNTLTAKCRKLDFRYVKPAAMLRGVMDFQTFSKFPRLFGRKCGVE